MSSRRSSGLQRLEWLLLSLGLACLAWYGVVSVRAVQFQRAQSAKLEQAVGQKSARPESPTIQRSKSSRAKKPDHQLIGRLEIPRVHLSVMVVDGDDDATLKVAAGHLPDTPLPWEFGNSAVAGHRDSFFRPLASVKLNDRLRLTTPHGEFNYTIANMRVVEPNDLSVLKQSGHSSLTLVTCYPFEYVGRAPKRFVVRADHIPG